MLGDIKQIREFIETGILKSGSVSLVAAMAHFVERHDEIPCLGQFNQALAQMAMPLVFDADTLALKLGDSGAEKVELSLADLMSVCSSYVASLDAQTQGFEQRVYTPVDRDPAAQFRQIIARGSRFAPGCSSDCRRRGRSYKACR